MSRVLITGANGQLGSTIGMLSPEYPQEFLFTDVEELDLSKAAEVKDFLGEAKPDYIINCAAYTQVDGAEQEEDLALILNRDVVANLLSALPDAPGCKLIHLSTDYIFKGDLPRPLEEDDHPEALSSYGKSKLEGEKLLWNHADSMVIRTSWLYGELGRNFVKNIMGVMAGKDEIRVVYDQLGTPTYASDLARTIMSIIDKVDSGSIPFTPGIYHYSNEGVCSWYDLTMAVRKLSQSSCRIIPVLSREYAAPAQRPAYAVLNKSKIKRVYGIHIPYWADSLEKCITNIISK